MKPEGLGGLVLALRAARPVIAHSICENVTTVIEVTRGNGVGQAREPLETLLCLLIPKVEGSVRTGGAEGAVLLVEANGIDSIDILRCRIAVTLEGKVLLATSFALLEVLQFCQVSETHHQHRHYYRLCAYRSP